VHHADRFVTERQVLPRPNAAADGVGIRGADERSGRPHDGVARTRPRYGLLHEAHLADLLHHKGVHLAPRFFERTTEVAAPVTLRACGRQRRGCAGHAEMPLRAFFGQLPKQVR
jgi:hypothetical protein